jgi:hypothetical protein
VFGERSFGTARRIGTQDEQENDGDGARVWNWVRQVWSAREGVEVIIGAVEVEVDVDVAVEVVDGGLGALSTRTFKKMEFPRRRRRRSKRRRIHILFVFF